MFAVTLIFIGYSYITREHPHGQSAVAKQIDVTSDAIIRAGLPAPRLFRPPFGRWEPYLDDMIRRRGMEMTLWWIDSEDWKHPGDPDRAAARVLKAAYDGGVVLLHDGHAHGDATGLKALPKIVAGLQAQGYCFGKLAPSSSHDYETSGESRGQVRIVPPHSGCTKLIALTFDDGPDPDITPKVLAFLRDHGHIQATFFVQGIRAKKYPEVLREIAADGHPVGNHAYDHPNLIRLWTGKDTSSYDRSDDIYNYGG